MTLGEGLELTNWIQTTSYWHNAELERFKVRFGLWNSSLYGDVKVGKKREVPGRAG